MSKKVLTRQDKARTAHAGPGAALVAAGGLLRADSRYDLADGGIDAAGAIFGGFNMLYAAFASRIRELATLQAVGFTRTAIFISLVQESLLATLTGTLCAAFVAVWLLEGQTIYFSIGAFSLQMSTGVVLAGLVTGILLGILGAIPPALRCLAAPLPAALRS